MNVGRVAQASPCDAAVFSGGIALGAFAAGAFAALDETGLSRTLGWVAGSSIGAVTAAIVAGNAPEARAGRLRQFWTALASDPLPIASFWFGPPQDGVWRQAYSQASVVQTLAFGRPGLFRPRLQPGRRAGAADVPALFDLAPLRAQLAALVDFERLNRGPMRVSIATTDVVSGERVVFDTRQGAEIGPEHLLASCALLPLFAPIELGGRLLGDGGLSSNAPVDLVANNARAAIRRCYVVDLFAPEGSRPHTLAASASRAGDLAFGNQSQRLLEAQSRENALRGRIARLEDLLPDSLRDAPEVAAILAEGRADPLDIVYVDYRAGLDEAGLGKAFDFSRTTIDARWQAGRERMLATVDPLLRGGQGDRRFDGREVDRHLAGQHAAGECAV